MWLGCQKKKGGTSERAQTGNGMKLPVCSESVIKHEF